VLLGRWEKRREKCVIIDQGIYMYIYMNDSNSHGVTDDITGDITGGLEHSGYIRSGLDRSTVGSITDLPLG